MASQRGCESPKQAGPDSAWSDTENSKGCWIDCLRGNTSSFPLFLSSPNPCSSRLWDGWWLLTDPKQSPLSSCGSPGQSSRDKSPSWRWSITLTFQGVMGNSDCRFKGDQTSVDILLHFGDQWEPVRVGLGVVRAVSLEGKVPGWVSCCPPSKLKRSS